MKKKLLHRPSALACAAALGAALGATTGCQTATTGVRSNQIQQYTEVAGTTEEVVSAAKKVLDGYGLEGVTAASTSLDGEASGSMADGTEVWVTAKRKSDTLSELTVQVGEAGDNALGQEIAGKVRGQLREDRM